MLPAESRQKTSLKRKLACRNPSSRKKIRHLVNSADALPWKNVSRPVEAGIDGDDGVLELEEVEGVEVLYEDTEGGRIVKFNVVSGGETDANVNEDKSLQDTSSAAPFSALPEEESERAAAPTDEFDSQKLLPSWHLYSLHPQLLRYLHVKTFSTPTPIQEQALPAALQGRDVVGVAETGSGKTLAYGLPILHNLLSHARTKVSGDASKVKRRVKALVLAPTRELALQVSSHLNACLHAANVEVKAEEAGDALVTLGQDDRAPPKARKKGARKQISTARGKTPQDSKSRQKGPPLVSIAAIVGGMSTQKQRRILDRGVDILIATPGRLWDIIEEDENLAKDLRNLKFLVLDEADRMVEAGHFAELDNILRLTLRQSREDEIEPSSSDTGDTPSSNPDGKQLDGMQTFVFSATLSKDLQRNLKKAVRYKAAGKKKTAPASTLDDLLLRLDFRDPEPVVIDLSPEGGVVETLKESKVECLTTDKDVYLYYFLLRYPGRTVVFLSSIDGIRRLTPLMELLNVKAFPLHSQLEQRQRLKNLDRFKSTPHCVLLATDIAARGLDVPAVDHVVHYQVPRTADAYVHRTGRTARAKRSGFALLMCAPDERRVVRALMASLHRQESDIPEMTVDLSLLDKLKARVQLARQIDSAHHKAKKQKHERSWLKETADAMELELDSDLASDAESDAAPSKQKLKAQSARNAAQKDELRRMLAQPLLVRGVSTRFITSGSRPIADELLAGQYNDEILGLKKADAGSDLATKERGKNDKGGK